MIKSERPSFMDKCMGEKEKGGGETLPSTLGGVDMTPLFSWPFQYKGSVQQSGREKKKKRPSFLSLQREKNKRDAFGQPNDAENGACCGTEGGKKGRGKPDPCFSKGGEKKRSM